MPIIPTSKTVKPQWHSYLDELRLKANCVSLSATKPKNMDKLAVIVIINSIDYYGNVVFYGKHSNLLK